MNGGNVRHQARMIWNIMIMLENMALKFIVRTPLMVH